MVQSTFVTSSAISYFCCCQFIHRRSPPPFGLAINNKQSQTGDTKIFTSRGGCQEESTRAQALSCTGNKIFKTWLIQMLCWSKWKSAELNIQAFLLFFVDETKPLSMAKQAVARKSAKKQAISDTSSNKRKKEIRSNIQNGTKQSSASTIFMTAFIVVGVACLGIFLLPVFIDKPINNGIKERHVQQNRKQSPGLKTI